jgi:chitin synthase
VHDVCSFGGPQIAAFFLAIVGVKNLETSLPDGQLNLDDVFTNAIFRNIVISLLATTGLYFIASFLFVGPTSDGEENV